LLSFSVESRQFILSLGTILPTCLRAAFMLADPKSAKRQSSHQCLFALLVSVRVKAVHKMLVILTTGGDVSAATKKE